MRCFARFRRFVLVFFDDILIYSRTHAEHLRHICTVLSALRAHGLVLKRSKCLFVERKIHYLGHVIATDGVAMDVDKVFVFQSWTLPKTVKALRGFLGLTSYYHKFVHEYNLIATALTALLKREAFRWTPKATTAFNTLKTALTTAPVLQLPKFAEHFMSTATHPTRDLAPLFTKIAGQLRSSVARSRRSTPSSPPMNASSSGWSRLCATREPTSGR
jgi:hypothetical protein